jgi:hypothetical protein
LGVINDLFIFVNDPYGDKKKIRVNPTLTEDKLQKIVEKTRGIIIELYVKCEMDYVDNLKVYEAIVESKILETTKKQIENLEKKANTMVSETNKKIVASDEIKPIGPLPPPPPPLPQVDPAAVAVPRNLPLMPPQVAGGITI